MELKVLGKFGPYPKANGGTSSYLLSSNNVNVLLDMGTGSFSKLSKVLSPEKIDVIFLSHFHFDHVSDFGIYTYYFERLFKQGKEFQKPILLCPYDDRPISKIIETIPFFDVKRVQSGDKFAYKGLDFYFESVNHPVPTLAVKISNDKTFTYGADGNYSEALEKLLSSSDLTVLDGGFLEKDYDLSKPHLSIKRCVNLADKYGKKVIISHINPSYSSREIKKELLGGKNCRIAKENKKYKV